MASGTWDLAAEQPQLYLVTDASPAMQPLEGFLAAAIKAGVGMVQLRDRTRTDAELLADARRFARVCDLYGVPFIVNDRADVALACDAAGVHVGQDDLPAQEARALLGPRRIVGLSTHSPEQIDAANSLPVDYIGVGPVYATPTKPGRPQVGLDLVRYAAAHSRVPWFAIGGIDPTTAADVARAGARSVSVLRCVARSADPAAAVRDLLAALASAAGTTAQRTEPAAHG